MPRVFTMQTILALACGAVLALAGCPTDDDDVADDDSAADDDTGDDDTGDDDTGDDDTGDDDTGDDDTGEACGFADDPAASVIVMERYTSVWDGTVSGRVQEAPNPAWHVIQLEEGACRYLTFQLGNCSPPCDFSQVCTADDECVDYPVGISAGTLTVEGLGDPIAIDTDDWNPGYYWGPWDLPDDLFDAGDPITATFSGADFPGLSLAATGVDAVDPSLFEELFLMADGADAVMTWTPGSDPDACVQVKINGANMAHGLPLNDILWCEGPDSGSLTIPQALVEAFPHGATPEICVGHDCPPSEFTRFTRDVTSVGPGAAQLEVKSTAFFGYDHP